MKTILTILLIMTLHVTLFAQNLAINGNGAVAHQSAVLDVSSTQKGMLVPRVTDTAVVNNAAIAGGYALAEGLIIYDITDHCLKVYNGTLWSSCTLPSNYPNNYTHCGVKTDVVEVTSANGTVWMDRNLGAYRAAISSTDSYSYGDLFQWGRFADGHNCRNTLYNNVTVAADQPNHNMFIVSNTNPLDWRVPQNNNLWQGVNGINNPCPNGFRLPTYTELNNEMSAFSSANAAGAFGSPLKLPLAGFRDVTTATIIGANSQGLYWTSTISGGPNNPVWYLKILGASANMFGNNKGNGYSVRCIKN